MNTEFSQVSYWSARIARWITLVGVAIAAHQRLISFESAALILLVLAAR